MQYIEFYCVFVSGYHVLICARAAKLLEREFGFAVFCHIELTSLVASILRLDTILTSFCIEIATVYVWDINFGQVINFTVTSQDQTFFRIPTTAASSRINITATSANMNVEFFLGFFNPSLSGSPLTTVYKDIPASFPVRCSLSSIVLLVSPFP